MGSHFSNLYWDATYAIAVALIEQFPDQGPEKVGLEDLAAMVTALPGFADDPALATEQLLLDILSTWYEELHSS